MADPIVLIARYTAKPGKIGAVIAALERMQPLVAAGEPGCTRYHVNRARENADTLLLYEEYADQAALEAHSATAYFQAIIIGEVIPLLERREREFFTPLLR